MLPQLNSVKGIHPGAILKRELKKRNLKAIDLANSIKEYPQTINAITKEKRGINPKLSIKLGDYFEIEREYFMHLQASFEVKSSINEIIKNPFEGKVRPSLFWDTDFKKLDFINNKRSIIQRILERGNEVEIELLINIYGLPVIREEVSQKLNSVHPNFRKNLKKYILSD